MKKSQNMPVWLNKMVLAQHFLTHFAEAGESKLNTCCSLAR
jgi:hypothetical protein